MKEFLIMSSQPGQSPKASTQQRFVSFVQLLPISHTKVRASVRVERTGSFVKIVATDKFYLSKAFSFTQMEQALNCLV